jgi:hypothetical protein
VPGVRGSWQGRSDGDVAALCYLDTRIAIAPPPAPGKTSRPFDREAVVTTYGVPTVLWKAGYHDALPPDPFP